MYSCQRRVKVSCTARSAHVLASVAHTQSTHRSESARQLFSIAEAICLPIGHGPAGDSLELPEKGVQDREVERCQPSIHTASLCLTRVLSHLIAASHAVVLQLNDYLSCYSWKQDLLLIILERWHVVLFGVQLETTKSSANIIASPPLTTTEHRHQYQHHRHSFVATIAAQPKQVVGHTCRT